MTISGALSDFSLAEIFQLLERGRKTGLLTLRVIPDCQDLPPWESYLWVRQGRIVAAANRLDQQGLVSLIAQRNWISDRVFDKLVHWCCPISEPVGIYLKAQGVLHAEQLKQLFQIQVLKQVCALFQLKEAEFTFEQNVHIPPRELTGLSVPATEVALVGLRVLRNWDALADKLPEASTGLASIIEGQPHYRLSAQEWQVWEYTKGTVSLAMIAQHLRLPVEKVQQIAFRLITVGLAEEMPLVVHSQTKQVIEPLPAQLIDEARRENVSNSFVQNLVGFLRSKVMTPQ